MNNIIIGGMQKHQAIKRDGICTCLTSSMGCGGGYVPMVVEENFQTINELLDTMYSCEDDIAFGKLKWLLYTKHGLSKKCPKCGSQLLESDLPQYSYLCFECDENFYECEVK